MVDQAVRHIDRPRLRAFRERFSGEVVLPDDETYDASRAVWNGMIDRRPALILRPTSVDEVIAAPSGVEATACPDSRRATTA